MSGMEEAQQQQAVSSGERRAASDEWRAVMSGERWHDRSAAATSGERRVTSGGERRVRVRAMSLQTWKPSSRGAATLQRPRTSSEAVKASQCACGPSARGGGRELLVHPARGAAWCPGGCDLAEAGDARVGAQQGAGEQAVLGAAEEHAERVEVAGDCPGRGRLRAVKHPACAHTKAPQKADSLRGKRCGQLARPPGRAGPDRGRRA
jgi:hypothetical protein